MKRVILHDSSGETLMLDNVWPVGSIYMSVNNTDPGTLFGGTWQQLKDRFLLAAGDTYSAGATGGEATHALTENEMPSHNHKAGHQNNLILTNQGGSQWPPLLISPDGNIAVYNTNTSSTGGCSAQRPSAIPRGKYVAENSVIRRATWRTISDCATATELLGTLIFLGGAQERAT